MLNVHFFGLGVELRGEGRDLVLDRLVYSDEGRYECRARNSISGHMFETKSKTIEVNICFREAYYRSWEGLQLFLYIESVHSKG